VCSMIMCMMPCTVQTMKQISHVVYVIIAYTTTIEADIVCVYT
jgi:hypothetical protein